MLAGLCRPDRKFGVETGRRDDIDNIDVLVVGDTIHRFVAVYIFFVQVVVRRPFLALFRVSGYYADKTAQFSLAQRRAKFARRISAEPDQCHPEFSSVVFHKLLLSKYI